MARGRQEAEWERTAWLMAWVGLFGGGKFDPDSLNPFRPGGRPAGGVTKADADRAFEAAERYLRGGG